jgi:uncharacterized protein (TIGR00725 family)
MKKQLQIGVMGSQADLSYSADTIRMAGEIGELIAQNNAICVFGAEKDTDSLPTVSARACKKAGGLTVGITYGKGQNIWGGDENDKPTIIIPCGLERGGGREFVLVNSCDAIIAIAGGSGTVTEMAIAYQANIPVVAVTGFGGWADEMANRFFDSRNRLRCIAAKTANEAVETAIKLAKETQEK